ncbi:uncharacterized protein LOC109533176 [Dendroctonus ponderosae]|uniref:uncharacterized protein LOC109533176 n=1 Tax=Dendroctonus ponderosae TaxID=77166 RepID=UPI002036258A|nr:uncharacterized protein LOC109533176 [Dendroctonus ponderosae]
MEVNIEWFDKKLKVPQKMLSKSGTAKCEWFLLIFGAVLSIGYGLPQNKCSGVCAGLGDDSSETIDEGSDSDYGSLNDYSDDFVNATNGGIKINQESLRFLTPCQTPNFEVSLCTEISKCLVLDLVKSKKKYSQFVEASKCGPTNEDPTDFKVCCGRYNSFRNVSIAAGSQSVKALPDISILPKKCGTQKQLIRGRIVGGKEAALGEYPWMARLIHKNSHSQKSYGCAGFLIHPKYVVTAAHCINSEFSEIRGDPYSVLLGEHNVTTTVDCSPGGTFCADPFQVSRINKIIIHENYDRHSKGHHNDIALIHLNKAIKLSNFVQPICLLSEENPETKKYFLSGWGKTEEEETSTVKMKLDLTPYDKADCKEKFNIVELEIQDSQICAGGEKMKDACNGDSGGPLMLLNGTQHYAAGLVSYGIGCGMPGWPGVYTSIPFYLDWILKQMLEVNTKSVKLGKTGKKNKRKKVQPVEDKTTTLFVFKMWYPRVLCLPFLLYSVHAQSLNGYCRTPSGESAKCISIYQCNSLLALVRTPSRTTEQTQFLTSSKCGFNSAGTPYVCCGSGFNKVEQSDGDFSNPDYTTNPAIPDRSQCGWQSQNRIYNGEKTGLDEFPWMALIQYLTAAGKQKTACAGSLINRRYILTAAHCVTGAVLEKVGQPINVRLGEYDTSSPNIDCYHEGSFRFCNQPEVNVNIETLIPHPGYNNADQNRRHDIALIRLSQDVQFSDYIQPVCLPLPSEASSNGETLIVAGWGRTEFGKDSDVKLKLQVPKVNPNSCSSTFGALGVSITENQICAGGEDGKDSCKGDSGGPLMRTLFQDSSRWMIEGVVSFGYICGTRGYPGVYTKVAKYVPWIHRTVKA